MIKFLQIFEIIERATLRRRRLIEAHVLELPDLLPLRLNGSLIEHLLLNGRIDAHLFIETLLMVQGQLALLKAFFLILQAARSLLILIESRVDNVIAYLFRFDFVLVVVYLVLELNELAGVVLSSV